LSTIIVQTKPTYAIDVPKALNQTKTFPPFIYVTFLFIFIFLDSVWSLENLVERKVV